MKRVLEPEIMNDEEQAIAYSKADFSSSNQWFVNHLIHDYSSYLYYVLDIGCRPADVPIRLARLKPSAHITAIDASDAMVELAHKAVKKAGVEKQIQVIKGCLPGFRLKHRYDAVLSKDLLHHLPDPIVLWKEIKNLAKPEAVVYIMDLFRPKTTKEARNIVERVAANENPILKGDFYNSLLASFTVEEIKKQLNKAGLDLDVRQVSERHLLIKGLINDIEH